MFIRLYAETLYCWRRGREIYARFFFSSLPAPPLQAHFSVNVFFILLHLIVVGDSGWKGRRPARRCLLRRACSLHAASFLQPHATQVSPTQTQPLRDMHALGRFTSTYSRSRAEPPSSSPFFSRNPFRRETSESELPRSLRPSRCFVAAQYARRLYGASAATFIHLHAHAHRPPRAAWKERRTD